MKLLSNGFPTVSDTTRHNPAIYPSAAFRSNADPFVFRFKGTYYCISTGMLASSSKDLIHWEDHGPLQLIGAEDFYGYWAPCVLYRNGVFYIYTSS
jgi:beta-xylosidase